MKKTEPNQRKFRGFTIVELMVVISVIGILSGIVVVSYNGWREKTNTTLVKSDLKSVATAMENYRNFNAGYPATIPTTMKPSEGVTLSYGGGGATTYCVTATSIDSPEIIYHIDKAATGTEPQEGAC